jgi:hypothetical protein
MKKTIAYDFDGVIHSFKKGWDGDVPKGKPIKDAKWAIEKLIEKGFTVIVFTTRTRTDLVSIWLANNGFPELMVTNTKPNALAYIDDRGIRFENNHQSIVKYFI